VELPAIKRKRCALFYRLGSLGVWTEGFGANSFALKEWPSVLPELHHAKRFLEILLAALQTENPHGAEEARHDAIARAACRAAIKANDPLALKKSPASP